MDARGRLAALLAGLLLAGCEVARELPAGPGYHEGGWADRGSARFHAGWLRDHGDALDDCKKCHGSDYAGGAVGVSCNSAGCHQRAGGPEFCGTCHGGAAGPRPATGAHAAHRSFCGECHAVPAQVKAKGHRDGVAQVVFSGLAVADGATPTWTAATQTCAGTHCHAGSAPVWKKPEGPVACDTCHGAPPATHARWSRVAPAGSCAGCHPVAPDPRHLDGETDLLPSITCDTCHGSGPLGAPAPALDGATEATARGTGAHRRHLDETIPDRIGKVVPCAGCHHVPASITAPGHLDTSAPADVFLPGGGTFDAATAGCTVDCHWDRAPGPVWTDISGGARACDACHGFPPLLTRQGSPHTIAPPTLAACLGCHPFSPETHVDGHVDLGAP